jgi:ribonuclease J
MNMSNQIKHKAAEIQTGALRITALGGINENGKNLWVYESHLENKIEYLVVDAGVLYPGYDTPGVDYVMAEIKYLLPKSQNIEALILSSPHEAHTGGAHHLINKCGIKKVIGSRLALELVKIRLGEEQAKKIDWQYFEDRKIFQLGSFFVKSYRMTCCAHDSFGVLIEAQNEKVFYTGTYKIDQTPPDGIKTDIAGISMDSTEIVGEGEAARFSLLISDSQGVEVEGYSASELDLISKFRKVMQENSGRIIFNTYNSNTLRIKSIFDLAEEYGRKIAFLNTDAKEVSQAMFHTGILEFKPETLINLFEIEQYDDNELILICTAPEGDAVREIEKIAFDRHPEFQLRSGDVLVNSADPPPGTVRLLAQIADQCYLKNVKILGGRDFPVHAHSHALTEEMKFMFNIARAKFFLPALGETRLLIRHAKLAVETGFDPSRIFILSNGDQLQFKNGEVYVESHIETGDVLFNHSQDFHVDEKILKEREQISKEGVVIVSFSLNKKREVVAGPVFAARACTFSKNKEWRAFCVMNTPSIIDVINDTTMRNRAPALEDYQNEVRDYMNKIIKTQIGKKPSVIVFANQV